MIVYGHASQEVDVMIRTRMTITTGQTQGWSFSLKHNASLLQAAGGDLTLNEVTTNGTNTAAAKRGKRPDTVWTAIRGGFNGYTQGVLIDKKHGLSLNPMRSFVTSKACYHIRFTPTTSANTVTFTFTHDIGDPPIRTVVVQNGLGIVPCASNFTLTVNTSPLVTPSPGGCSGFDRGPHGGGPGAPGGVALDGPVIPDKGTPQALFRRGDANSDGIIDISDPVLTLGYLFQGQSAPPCLDAADANDQGPTLDIADAIYTLAWLFSGGSAPPPPVNCGDGPDTTSDELDCKSSSCDSDGDGLSNTEEQQLGTDPAKADTDIDGFTDFEEVRPSGVDGFNISAAPWFANPTRPDIFVEIDWYDYQGTLEPIHNHKPNENAMNAVVTAFSDAPITTFVNGQPVSTGIALHIDFGQFGGRGGNAVVWHDELWPDTELLKEKYMAPNQSEDCIFCGTLHAVKYDPARGNFDPLRDKVFHYSLWGHVLFLSGDSAGGWTQRIPHENFAITLGHEFWGGYDADRDGRTWTADGDIDDKILVEGGIFMHELGHNLGLFHGGFDDAYDCKPNYDSVMNYRYTIRGVDENCDWIPSRSRLDYSRSLFADVDESNLREDTGMCGVPIDWNGDGDELDSPVVPPRDVNNDDDLAALPGEDSRCRGNGQIQAQLIGFDDWSFIKSNGMGTPRIIPPGYWTPTDPCDSAGNCSGGPAGGGIGSLPCLLKP